MSNWTDVAAVADLFEGAGIPVTPEGHDIALFSVEGEVFAIDNLCSHGNAKLCDAFVEGHNVSAPSIRRSSACAMVRSAVAQPRSRPGLGRSRSRGDAFSFSWPERG